MPAAYRDSISAISSGSTISVDPSTLTYSSGDVLLLHVFGYTSIGAPSGSDLTWTEILSDTQAGPFSNTDIHKVFWAVADASITSFTLAHGLADQWGYCLMSISGADTGSPIDGTPQITSALFTGSSNPTALAVTTTGSDSLLVVGVGVWRNGDVTNAFDWSGSGMTEREDFESWDAYTVATESLGSSGSTGTRAVAESPEGGSLPRSPSSRPAVAGIRSSPARRS
jgi:hypothetical protein